MKLFCVVMIGAALAAQDDNDYLRQRTFVAKVTVPGAQSGDQIRLEGQTGGPMSAVWLDDQAGVRASIPVPFTRIAGVACVSSDPMRAYLFGSTSSTQNGSRVGGCVVLECSFSGQGQPQMTLPLSLSYPTLDPCQVICLKGSSAFWLLDYGTRNIYCGQVPAYGGVPQPSSWVLAADASSIPALASPMAAHYGDLGVGPNGKVTLDIAPLERLFYYEFALVNGQPQCTAIPRTRHVDIEWPEFITGHDPITFHVGAQVAANSYEVRDFGGALIANGSVSANQPVVIPPLAAMWSEPGLPCTLSFPGTSYESTLRPSIRYGPAGSTNTAFTVGRAIYWPSPVRGDLKYGSGVTLTTSLTGAVVGYLAVALRDGNGTDPVTYVSGSPLLSATATEQFTFNAQDVRNSVGRKFPIPNNSLWDGQVVLFQYWFLLPGGGVAVSEVFGSGIQCPDGGYQISNSSARASSSSQQQQGMSWSELASSGLAAPRTMAQTIATQEQVRSRLAE